MKKGIHFLSLIFVLSFCFLQTSRGQAQSLQHYVDSNCQAVVALVDSAGNIVSNHPPYLFSTSTTYNNSNSLASATIDLSSLSTSLVNLTVTDGLQNSYTTSFLNPCAQNAAPPVVVGADTNATQCNICDGVAVLVLTDTTGIPPYLWSIDNSGPTTTTVLSLTANNLCPGGHNVMVTDGNGQQHYGTFYINCNNSPATVQANCQSFVSLDVGLDGIATVGAQSISSSPIIPNNSYLLAQGQQLQQNYIFDCSELGYHQLTLLVVDSVLQSVDSCQTIVEITDTTNQCGGTQGFDILANQLSAISCNSCTGAYNFTGIFDSVSGGTAAAPYTFVWHDGLTQASRNDLCPYQSYMVTVYDANGVRYTDQVMIGCPTGTSSACIDTADMNPAINCPHVYQPVCGCDSITYLNACAAFYGGGLQQWTQGPCQSQVANLQVIPIAVPSSFGCDSLTASCNGSINLQISGGTPPYSFNWADTSLSGSGASGLCAGNYLVVVTDNNGMSTTVNVNIGISACVWPGDTDDNTVANNYDLLPIGLAYGLIGIPRGSVSIAWAGQLSQNWNLTFPIPNLPDHKYFDCNGDAAIDSLDVAAISNNYGQQYSRFGPSSLFGPTPIYTSSSLAQAGDTVSLDIFLGDSMNTATNIYGLAFTLHYDANLVESNTASLDFSNSWLGNNLIDVQRDFPAQGQIDGAVSRIDQTTVTGMGAIGRISFTIRDDLVMGRVNHPDSTLKVNISISDVRLIDNNNTEIGTNPQSSSIKIIESTAVNHIGNNTAIKVYPNPASNILIVEHSKGRMESIELMDSRGRLIRRSIAPQQIHKIDVSDLPKGVYWLSVQTTEGIWTDKVMVD